MKRMKHARRPWRRLAAWTAVLSLLGVLLFPFAPPALAGSAPRVMKIGSGHYSSSGYAVKSDGTAWAWGDNSKGELGNNSATNSSVAVQVLTGAATPLTGITAIAGGERAGYAVKSDGTAWAWGFNFIGALGNNSTTNSSVAVQVLTGPSSPLTGITAIAGGRYTGYALDNQGQVWAWGYNYDGELGNNSTTNSLFAVRTAKMTGATMQASAGPAGLRQATVTAAVYDAYNNPVPGAVVSFQVSSGPGTLASPTATTSASGLATDTVTGSAPGTVTVQAGSGTLNAAPVTVPFVSVATAGLPGGLAGAPYSATLAASGGSGYYTWSATGLPPGLSVSSGSVISGTPPAAGTSTVAVTVTDGAGYTDTVSLGLTVTLNITTTSLPDGLVGASYSATLSAGGSGSYTWSATGLPPGLSVSSGGAVSGTPTTAGVYTITINLADSAGHTASKNIALTVYQPLSTITLPAATAGASYSTTLAASGGSGSYTWSATGLPPGLSISSGGIISGTPTATGTYPMTVTVDDSVGHTTSLSVSLTVNPAGALAVTTTSLPVGTAGNSYSVTLAAVGGSGSYTWSATGLPAGLSISSGGVISGTPSAAGTYSVAVTVTDGAGNTASQNISLTINPVGTLSITTTSLPGGTAGNSYSATLAAGGGSGSYTWSATGLPPGLGISAGGVISGTPTTAGTYSVAVTVTDGASNTANGSLVLSVSQSGGSGGGGGGGSSATPQPISITTGSATVNPAAGGTVSLGSAVSLTIPAGALAGNASVPVTVQPASSVTTPPSGLQVLGTVYRFTVNGQDYYTFNGPVTLTFTFDPSKLPAGETPAVYYYDETAGKWVDLGGTVSGNTITVKVSHFTRYAVMTRTHTSPASPVVTLSDIAGNWAKADIEKLVSLGAISGYPDGTFKPDSTITRAEFACVLVKALKLAPKDGPVFSDTQKSWAKDYISTAAAYGIASGYDATHFGPSDLITREQMAAMVVRAASLAPLSVELTFKDAPQINSWARGYVAAAVKEGLLNGYPDGTFRPLGYATRAEAVTVIAGIVK